MPTVEKISTKTGLPYSYTYEHPSEKERARRKAYYGAHKEEAIARAKQWQLDNPERARIYSLASCKRHYYKHKPHIKFRENHTARYLFRLAKKRAAISGFEFNLNVEDIVIPTVCPLLGIPVDIKSPVKDEHPSLDRVDNTKGYVKGNVLVVSYRGNRLKSDSTAEELRRLARNLERLIGGAK